MAENLTVLNDENFQAEVMDSQLPVLVDFWAPWCGPCRMLGPTIEQLAAQYQGKLKVGKLNTDDSPDTASKYSISAIPTVMIFKGGQKVEHVVGVRSRDDLAKLIDQYV